MTEKKSVPEALMSKLREVVQEPERMRSLLEQEGMIDGKVNEFIASASKELQAIDPNDGDLKKLSAVMGKMVQYKIYLKMVNLNESAIKQAIQKEESVAWLAEKGTTSKTDGTLKSDATVSEITKMKTGLLKAYLAQVIDMKSRISNLCDAIDAFISFANVRIKLALEEKRDLLITTQK